MKKIVTILVFCLMLPRLIAQTNDIASDFIKANDAMFAGNYSDAVIRLQNIYEKTSSTQNRAIVVHTLSLAYIQLGRYKEAEPILLETLDTINKELGKNVYEYRLLETTLAQLYYDLYNYDKANAYIQEAKALFEENLDFGDDYIKCLSLMSAIQNELGYKAVGRMLIDVAVRQARSNYQKYSKDSILQDSHKYYASQYAQLLSNAAATYCRVGYLGDGVSLLKEAISVSSSVGLELPYCYVNLADIYFDKSNYQESIVYYEKALSLTSSPYDFEGISMSLSLAKMFANHPDAADVTLKTSKILKSHQQYVFTFLSERERQDYWENSGHNIPLQNYIYQQNGNSKYHGAIYNNLLYSKGLLLRATNDLYNRIEKSGNSKMVELYRSLQNAKSLMLVEKDLSEIDRLQQRCDSIDKVLIGFCGQQYGTSSKEITWEDIRYKLHETDIAIEFYCVPNIVMDENNRSSKSNGAIYYAATLRRDYTSPRITRLLSSKELELLQSDFPFGSVELFNRIWKPLMPELGDVKNIYFSADRELHKIAIESLIDEDCCTASNMWNIYRLSSTRELLASRENATNGHYALFGGLNYSAGIDDITNCLNRNGLRSASIENNVIDSNPLYRAGVRYLPGTKLEVECIKQELEQTEKNTNRLYTGLEGTEEMLKSLSGNDINVIHLATHGYYWKQTEAETPISLSSLINNKDANSSALIRSGILMTGANHALKGETIPSHIEDGIVTAQEISTLDYRNVSLVVLSACQSALGEVDGEGVYGLQRGFKLAGVQSLLMALWPVDDQATQMLMVEFYKHFISGESKAVSLRKAQQYIKSQPGFEDPEYWAGFILLDALE